MLIIIMTFLGEFLMNNTWGIIIVISTIVTVFVRVILSLASKLDTLESKIDKLSAKTDAE